VARYLVIAPQGLGDSLEATPFLQALRAAKPDAVIHVAAMRPVARDLFEALPQLVDSVLYLPYWERGAAAFLASLLRCRVRARRYDAAFLMYPAARAEYHALARAFPARRRFAHRYWPSRARALQWLNSDLVPVAQKHNVLRNLDLLRAAGIAFDEPRGYVAPLSWVEPRELRDNRRVALHVGTIAHSGLESRRWPLAYFVRAAQWLVENAYETVAIMGPAERAETRELQARVPGLRVFEGTLPETARFLSTCALVVTNDSGIGHLAAAVGTQIVALFGPTPLEHAPFGPNVTALRPSTCPPCFDVRLLNTECALGIDYACLKRDLQPEYVIGAIAERLQTGRTAAPRSEQPQQLNEPAAK
jgi:heptosyltransferase-2